MKSFRWRPRMPWADMDVLFLCHRIPYPPDKGDKIRSHALLKQLAKNHRVHLACFIDEPGDFAWCDAVRRIAGGECLFVRLTKANKSFRSAMAFLTGKPVTISTLESRAIRQWISALTRAHRIGAAVVFSSGMAPYVLDDPQLDPASSILDMVDVDSDKWRQYATALSGPRAWIFRREARTLERFERLAVQRFGATLLVSDYEAKTFAALAPESDSRIFALANGVDLDFFSTAEFPNPFRPDELPVVMTGRMDYRPNIDAVEWFLREVMPRLKRDLPAVRFYAVGANPPRSWRRIAGPGFEATGKVDDIRPYIQHAAAAVAPLRMARGIQNKVLEAMAMGKSVVATHEATRGLNVMPGTDLLVANDPDGFAAAVMAAIRRVDLGKNARRYVERHHDWSRNLADLDQHLARAGNRVAGTTPFTGSAWSATPVNEHHIAEPAR